MSCSIVDAAPASWAPVSPDFLSLALSGVSPTLVAIGGVGGKGGRVAKDLRSSRPGAKTSTRVEICGLTYSPQWG
jgi:hypothetical protein